jgi:hypothetical protein
MVVRSEGDINTVYLRETSEGCSEHVRAGHVSKHRDWSMMSADESHSASVNEM